MRVSLRKLDRRMLDLIDQLQMARRRGEPAYIDRETLTLAVPDGYDYFARYSIGGTFGKYGEPITKLVRGRRGDPAPFWFAPKANANHIALVSPYDTVLYMEVRHNPQARAEKHPFDLTVAVLAEQAPRVVSLFDFLPS
jgi:hypothetical protein